ncbi:SRPBCC family protein [Hoyosella altamirensis]|uniref:Uncharacterized protein YndB with AHSA1/START domain n=1 Tax=Hoyosella altamirensis TaxID=616997 RepID=A0A839RKT3_9ACTN|nr:SRPBCC family protein [Hoyosella altamirensis]MBB3036774.1 uncharacterized protein YndB with AHSA1/START domain [Hoyosella altamirensis]
MIDVIHQINAVTRSVESRTLEAGDARVVTASQVYDTDVKDLWDAVTNPERLPRWFSPVSGDLQQGGTFQVEGNAGGTISACDPPHGFSATWEYGESVSWISVRISPAEGGHAQLELEHTMLADDHWTQYGPGATGVGWDSALLGLTLHLRSGEAADPKAAEKWMMSEDGIAFMTGCGNRWGAAHIEAGADAATAEAAAQRTIAFYTTVPE